MSRRFSPQQNRGRVAIPGKAGVAAPFDPTTLSMTGYWRASFTGSPWVPTATAGASGTNGNLTTGGGAPTVGTAVNGKTPATFNGSTQNLNGPTPASTFLSGSGGGIICLFNASAAAAPVGGTSDPAVFCNQNGEAALTFTSSGVQGFAFDATTRRSTPFIACATGGWHLAMVRWTGGGTVGITLDSAAEQTTALTGTYATAMGGVLRVGCNFNGSVLWAGSLLETMLFSAAPTNANYTNIKSYINTTYGLAL